MMYKRAAGLVLLLALLCTAPVFSAEPDKLRVSDDSVRCAPFGIPQTLQVHVEGKEVKTMLGGSCKTVAEGVKVRFEIFSQPEGSEPKLSEADVTADAGGSAKTTFTATRIGGVFKVRVSLPDYPSVSAKTVTFLGGVKLNDKQDGWISTLLGSPVTVLAQTEPGKAAVGVPVTFDLRKYPKGTKLLEVSRETGNTGRASAEIKLGSKQGSGELGIQILGKPWYDDGAAPTLKYQFFAIDRVGLAIAVLGGLAIFVFGMKLMSEGLSLIAGDRLRSLLGFLTRNRFAAVGVGAVTTGLIQSSSACSVMVIGFVNAGLMQLEQAIGVIMGANIGTTVTAQMLSFKLEILAQPAIALGVIVMLFAKRNRTKFVAQIMVGFGLLFMGMGMMSAPLKELSASDSIRRMFDGLSCTPGLDGSIYFLDVIKAVAAGTLLTVVVQSSSASIGLLLTLAGAGFLDVYTSMAILLGDNIGTTITAMLASIGTSRAAKRTACAHVLFNVIGTIVMIFLFFVPWNGHPVFMEMVSKFTGGDPFAGENLPRFLANAHTSFNVVCTVAFVWFLGLFAAATRIIVPGADPVPSARRLLEPNLLATPAIAIEQAWGELGIMLQKGREAISSGSEAVIESGYHDFDNMSDSVKALENEVDELQSAITQYVSSISQEALTEEQGLELPRVLHSVNDAERIGDHAMHLVKLARRTRKRDIAFSEDAKREVGLISNSVSGLFENALKILGGDGIEKINLDNAEAVRKNFQESNVIWKLIKKQASDFRKSHEARQSEGQCDVSHGVIFVDTLLNYHRVGGHLMNIIEAATPDKYKQ